MFFLQTTATFATAIIETNAGNDFYIPAIALALEISYAVPFGFF